jgi:hypothetical protein
MRPRDGNVEFLCDLNVICNVIMLEFIFYAKCPKFLHIFGM